MRARRSGSPKLVGFVMVMAILAVGPLLLVGYRKFVPQLEVVDTGVARAIHVEPPTITVTRQLFDHPKPVDAATGPRTESFDPAPGLFAERDVQYVGNVPHCILRLTMADVPDGTAVYAEATMQWCEGVR